ncbi:MAG: prolyl aminopeptidase [Alphaproteobacteria bacterium]
MIDELFPEIEPYNTGFIELDDIHTMYFEESGNPDGIPVVIFHGGPGAGNKPQNRQIFNPSIYRIILFDQRGALRSTPLGELKNNTTDHLVADIETLREHLGIEKWLLFGSSWGSTLAMLYGIKHPDRCYGFILHGIFLGRQRDIQWGGNGVRAFHPEAWNAMMDFLPEEERDDHTSAYHKRITSPDPAIHLPAAAAYLQFQFAIYTYIPEEDCSDSDSNDDEQQELPLHLAKIEIHYFANNLFMEDNYILNNINAVSSHPVTIIHGRYDMCCPPEEAYELAKAWGDNAQLIMISDAGHSKTEHSVIPELIETQDVFAEIIGQASQKNHLQSS